MKIKIWLLILSVMCLLLSFACAYNYNQFKILERDCSAREDNLLKQINKTTQLAIKNDEMVIALTLDYLDRSDKQEAFDALYDHYIESKGFYKEWREKDFN